MNVGVNCPLCNSSEIIYNFRESEHELYSCEECDLHFIDPYIQNEVNRNPLSSEKQHISEKLAVNYYLPHIKSIIENKASLLDIGCGCGELLKRCKELNIKKIVGLENDADRAKFAEKHNGCLIINKDFLDFQSNEKYDVVTLINVISHIPDLNVFFEKVRSLLNEKGQLIIKTGLMLNGFKQKNGYDWQIPEHVHFLGNRTPEYIAKKFNLRLAEKTMIPLADDLISNEYLLSPGRSPVVNFLKRALLVIPFGSQLVKHIYSSYTKNKLFTAILVFEK